MQKNKLVVGAALAGMAFAMAAHAEGKTEKKAAAKTTEVKGECSGVNSCKGTGECGGKGHACAGKNECKGQGWMSTTEADCKGKKGEFHAKNDVKKDAKPAVKTEEKKPEAKK